MWKKLSEEKPPDDGFYLVYINEVNDLGKSEFIWIANWNMQYGDRGHRFEDIDGADDIRKGAQVTHWMPMPERPRSRLRSASIFMVWMRSRSVRSSSRPTR